MSDHEAGNQVMSNGSSNRKNSDRVFKCSGHDKHSKSTVMKVAGDNQHRGITLVSNGKENRRPKGKKKARKVE